MPTVAVATPAAAPLAAAVIPAGPATIAAAVIPAGLAAIAAAVIPTGPATFAAAGTLPTAGTAAIAAVATPAGPAAAIAAALTAAGPASFAASPAALAAAVASPLAAALAAASAGAAPAVAGCAGAGSVVAAGVSSAGQRDRERQRKRRGESPCDHPRYSRSLAQKESTLPCLPVPERVAEATRPRRGTCSRSRTVWQATAGERVGGDVSTEISRRELLEDAAAVAAAAALGGTLAGQARAASHAIPRIPASQRGKRVAVLGGGMAGLAAAHELRERGFIVDVFERKSLGGKARSFPTTRGAGGRHGLPGEHGFRFFPGFYHHVPDSMRRIPFGSNPHGVWDNLVSADETKSPRTQGRADGTVFGIAPDPNETRTPDGMRRVLLEAFRSDSLPPHELSYFVERVMVFLTSCDERRFGQWEHVSWWDFIRAEGKSDEYKKVVARGLTRAVVAAKEKLASTRTIGNMGEAFIYNIQGRGNDGAPDRVLNAPTNEAWIDPWVALLTKMGVRFHVGQTIDGLNVRHGRIDCARVRDARGRKRWVFADWFVCAMPAERARRLWSHQIVRHDPKLELMNQLFVDWMNGIQFYLRKPLNIVRGHMTFIDAPWALTALTQEQFWANRKFPRDYGDGSVVDCLSVDVSDWDTPGIVYRKPAKLCTRPEIAHEVLEQIKLHLNDNGSDVLTDDMVHSWHLDPAIAWSPRLRSNTDDEPLLVNTVGTWEKRPTARSKIPNLFLAGDYVQTNVDLATMEGANESGRAAVNALLDAAGSKKPPAAMYKLYVPPEFEGEKRADAELYRNGRPNSLDVA
ncbi:MAG: hypothetical protein QOE65_2150 [Solirubrobacteraceae bacterium]|jgi:uncharacterized protein with NAD-binding domain and iron-sulfur cluster|nr:hypothetical protein [Solirubrobacteraceae bacterium]